jgi:hypothetical protein
MNSPFQRSFVFLAITLSCVGLFSSCGLPLKVRATHDKVIVDVQTLGEYPTTVNRIRLTGPGAEPIWEIRSKSGLTQIWTLTFLPGPNSVDMAETSHGEYIVLIPQPSKTFELKRKTEYVIEMWDENADRHPTRATLHFPE